MKVVITGATGNVGTSVLEALSAEERIEEIVGLGLQTGSDHPTPPLARQTSGPLRVRELLTGVGARS